MLRVSWVLIVNAFLTLNSVYSSEFPEFFDNYDLKELGVKGKHRSSYVPATVTGRSVYRPPGARLALSEQDRQKIPPNGLPINPVPPGLQTGRPIKPIGRDPTAENIIQQLQDEDNEKPFPPPDGKPYGGDDTDQLAQLPRRLTDLNMWDEFKALIAEEGEKHAGRVMANWEDDAHRWAQYSRHLLERAATEKKKEVARSKPKQIPPWSYTPSLGHEAYWGDPPESAQPSQYAQPSPYAQQSLYGQPSQYGQPSPQMPGYRMPYLRPNLFPTEPSPFNEKGQLISWRRRQMNDPYVQQSPNAYNDNLQGPLDQNKMPPIYYKNPNTPDDGPTRQEYAKFAQMDYPDGLRTGDLGRYLPPYPEPRVRTGPEFVPAGEYSPNLLTNFKTPNQMPGPGSERDYPNGYSPYSSQTQLSSGMNPGTSPGGPTGGNYQNYINDFSERIPKPPPQSSDVKYIAPKEELGNDSVDYPGPSDYADPSISLLRMGQLSNNFQGGPESEGVYPGGISQSMAGANMGLPTGQTGVGPLPGGKYSKNFGVPAPNQMPETRSTLRDGGGYPNMDYQEEVMRQPNVESAKSSLRSNGMGGNMRQPGPGSEAEYPYGFQPQMSGANMGLPPLPKQLGPLPGRVPNRPMGGESEEMPSGPSPGGYSPGGPIGTPALPKGATPKAIGYPGAAAMGAMGNNGPPHVRPYGQGAGPGYAYPMRPPPALSSRIPSGYELLTLAKKKIAATDRIDEISDDAGLGTTTPRPLTKEEILRGLPQFDDFHAPIRWVTFNSPDLIDGLARVTDRKTHQNQQYVVEGVLYVPIIDESMSRLGWTTEDPFATEPPITAPPNDSILKVVVRSMDLNKTDEREWLAYETILGAKKVHAKECSGQSCQARCHKTGCDSVCKGDTCATGCVGISCNAVCKGPGCFSMCIGDQCSSKCEGLNCETRCWGKNCEADCHSFSCQYTVNGVESRGNATWDQMYPQYVPRGNPDVYSKPDQRMGQYNGPGEGPPNIMGDDYYAD